MIKAGYNDRERIIDILAASFEDNKSVDYILKKGTRYSDPMVLIRPNSKGGDFKLKIKTFLEM